MSGRSPLVLATANAGKVREFNRLLAGFFAVHALPEGVQLPAETADSFVANARLKAEWVFDALGGADAVLADDSGLEVPALGGRPGVYSARYAGEGASDRANVAKLLEELSEVADRSACFVCALCLAIPAGGGTVGAFAHRLVEVRGISRGSITQAPRGSDGFGYDPVFRPRGWKLTLAEAPPEEKDRVSHRGAAARKLLECLGRLGGA